MRVGRAVPAVPAGTPDGSSVARSRLEPCRSNNRYLAHELHDGPVGLGKLDTRLATSPART